MLSRPGNGRAARTPDPRVRARRYAVRARHAGAAALIALANGHGALGIFAANHLTELVWGAAAALLVVLSQLPRVGGKTKAREGDPERLRATPLRPSHSAVELLRSLGGIETGPRRTSSPRSAPT